MDHQDLRTLRLLEEIEKNYAPSQRDLARKLNVSLGLVNSFVKRLAHKGYFKVTTIPRNRVKYMLTPKGVAEKTRLTYEFVQYSFEFYKNARSSLRALLQELDGRGGRRIVFYGVGELAEIAYVSLQETPGQLVGVVDDKRAGERFLGFVVKEPGELSSLSFDNVLITAIGATTAHVNRILQEQVPMSKLAWLEMGV